MRIIDADMFLGYLIFSKHIDSLNCKEVRETVELCTIKDIYTKADIMAMLTELQSEINDEALNRCVCPDWSDEITVEMESVDEIIQRKIDKYKAETESQEYESRKSEEKKTDDCVSFSLSNIKDIIGKLQTKCITKYGLDSIYAEALYDFAYEIRTLLHAKNKYPNIKVDIEVRHEYGCCDYAKTQEEMEFDQILEIAKRPGPKTDEELGLV